MARAHAKTNPTSKSSQKSVSPPPPPAVTASNTAAAPVTQAQAPKEIKPAAAAPAVQAASVATPRPAPSQEQIARRAYELFLARGGEHGHHDEDWNQAERDLRLGC
jgi:hypothetical protein